MSASSDGGIRFGPYLLVRRLARGGMAEVFLAQQRGLEGFDRRLAVKRILPHLADTPDFVRMFLKEAQLAAQLNHPNIVHIYDFGKVDRDYFIAMEFIDGVHAGQLFKHAAQEKLPPALVARLGADAAAALHHAHELRGATGGPIGLVHRDVSPANLMVSFDGVAKLCDFGIAKAAAITEDLTSPGQVKGKYAYMSPEQTTASPLDGRSDVFSLGIVLWELLAGRPIVTRGDAVEAMRQIRDGNLPAISLVAPTTPPPLAKALTWALQKRREDRPSAMELAHALETFVKGSPELATPMQLGAWIRERFARVTTGAQEPLTGRGARAASAPAAEPRTRVSGTQLSPPTEDVMELATGDIRRLSAPELRLSAPELLDGAATVMEGRRRPPAAAPRVDQPPQVTSASQATQLASAGRAALATQAASGSRAALATRPAPAVAGPGEAPADPVGTDETGLRSGAGRLPVPGSPGSVPTRIAPRIEARDLPPIVRPEPLRRHLTPVPADWTDRPPGRGRSIAVMLGVLSLVAITSFLIALAVTSSRQAPRAPAAGSAARP